jgi:hypothetical protein
MSGASTIDTATAALAERVMGWRAAPDRFLKSNRVWIPRWRFQPFSNAADALTLLDAAKPDEYAIQSSNGAQIKVSVRIGGRIGTAAAATMQEAIATAVARAVGVTLAQGPTND